MTQAMPKNVDEAFSAMDERSAICLHEIRNLLFDVAHQRPEVGPITETLKWGEPAYVTEATKSGSTLRLAHSRKFDAPAIFVMCSTNLVEQCKEHYRQTFDYDGKRGIILDPENLPIDAIRHVLALALTYNSRKAAA